MGCHEHEVCVDLSRPLMEVARPDTGDVSPAGGYVDELRVDLELFWAEDDVDPRVLHLLAPADIGLLVEAGKDLDDRSHPLTILGSCHQSLDDLGALCHSVERDTDLCDLGANGGLLE